jgi:hypothetical protein
LTFTGVQDKTRKKRNAYISLLVSGWKMNRNHILLLATFATGIGYIFTTQILPELKSSNTTLSANAASANMTQVSGNLEAKIDSSATFENAVEESCSLYPPPELYNKSKEYLQLLIDRPRLRAMLNLIADYEGKGSSSQSYCTTVSGAQFTGNTHPGEDAGRYNIPVRVWYGSASELGFTTFGPLEQDLVGVFLIDQKMGALNHVLSENDNDLRAAINMLAYQWKGLPKEENQNGIDQAIADFNNKYYPEALAGQEIIFKNTESLRALRPTAIPQPTSSYYPVMTYEQVLALCEQVFPKGTAEEWVLIARKESSFNPMAIGDNGNSLGLFQIYISVHNWPNTPEFIEYLKDPFNPYNNARLAKDVSGGGCFTGAWTTAALNGIPDKLCP